MKDLNHLTPQMKARLTVEQADSVKAYLQGLHALRSAIAAEEREAARWTLRVMENGLGSEQEQEALATWRRTSTRRADAAADVEDLNWRLDEQLAAGAPRRQSA